MREAEPKRLKSAGDSAKPERTIEQVSGIEDKIIDKADEKVGAEDAEKIPEMTEGVSDLLLPDSIELMPEPLPVGPTEPIELEQVVDAIYQSYPLLRIAIAERAVAAGENVMAQGEFDLKLKGETVNQALGFTVEEAFLADTKSGKGTSSPGTAIGKPIPVESFNWVCRFPFGKIAPSTNVVPSYGARPTGKTLSSQRFEANCWNLCETDRSPTGNGWRRDRTSVLRNNSWNSPKTAMSNFAVR